MPLLGRHKSPSSSSQSSASQHASSAGGGSQQAAAIRQQVCESPLFGIRRQLGRDKKDSGGEIVSESQAKRELGSVPQQITREQIHYAFSIMDTNKDGLIDLRDLSQMLSNLGVPIDEAILSHIMSSVSKRGDHRISEAEFVDWIAHFIQITDSVGPSKATTAAAANTRPGAKQVGRFSRATNKVARSSTAASCLMAQTTSETYQQMQRSRRGSGSGLALMRSLSSSCTSSSGSPPETGAAFNLKPSQPSPVLSSSLPPSLSSSSSSLANQVKQQQQQKQQRQLKREPSNDSEARDDLKAAFCVFDLDGDGYITQEEVRAGLKLLGETWSPAELRRLFNKCSNSHQPNDLSKSAQQQQQQQQQQRISIDDFVNLLL